MKHKHTFIKVIAISSAILAITGCATQRYGRATPVTSTERQMLTCREINIELAKSEEFVAHIRAGRRGVSGRHVLGALADFGIGNVMEGDEAEESGEERVRGLRELKAEKRCSA